MTKGEEMAAAKISKRKGPRGERNELSAFVVRALMAFLGTVGACGCLMSGLGFTFRPGIFDMTAATISVLFTYAMFFTGYHPLCAAAEAAVCLLFGLVRAGAVADGLDAVAARYMLIRESGTGIVAAAPGGAEAEMAAAFFGSLLACTLIWIMGQNIRRVLPILLITGIFPAVSVSIGVIPGYLYLLMLCLLWGMLFFDADELNGTSIIIMPLVYGLLLAVLAVGPHMPHEQIDFTRPMGEAAVPTTVGGENHDPISETIDTGETQENHDRPEDAHPGGESDILPDGQDENGAQIPRRLSKVWFGICTILILFLLFPLIRFLRLWLRKRETHSKDRNASAIALYRYMEQLRSFAGEEEDASEECWLTATEIGLKARFSGEMISAQELREMRKRAFYYREICMKRVKTTRRLYGEYCLAL